MESDDHRNEQGRRVLRKAMQEAGLSARKLATAGEAWESERPSGDPNRFPAHQTIAGYVGAKGFPDPANGPSEPVAALDEFFEARLADYPSGALQRTLAGEDLSDYAPPVSGDRPPSPRRGARLAAVGSIIAVALVAVGVVLVIRDDDRVTVEQTSFTHTFPATYEGTVWTYLRSADPGPRDIRIEWGAYQRNARVDVDADGVILVYTKEKDEEAEDDPAPVVVSSDPPVIAEFGTGDPPADLLVRDVSAGWQAATSK